jgi:hypothetical protein
MITRRGLLYFSIFITCFVGNAIELSAQHNSSWGRPPDGWDDFYLGLVNDYKKANEVGETGYWIDVIHKANGLSTYNAADPTKKSVLYQYKYINAGVDTSTNWNNQKSLVPYGMNLLPDMRYSADLVGMRNAWVIYMMQEDIGTPALTARDNMANAVWLKKYFLNIKYVAQTGAGRKEIFILEPDLFGYIIEYLWNAGQPSTGMSNGVGLAMTAPMSTIAADPEYSYLAGLPNDFRGVVQGMIRTIRKYNPEAYCGVTINLWGANTSSVMGPAPAKRGLVWYNTAQIDAAVAFQSAFFQGLLLNAGYDKGDFLIPEKNGYSAGNWGVVSGYDVKKDWMWGDQQMENYLYFFEKMGKSVCLPLLAWQVSLGQSNDAAGFGITLTNPPTAPYVSLSNSAQGYEDTYMQYFFNNVTKFINAGFIGVLAGRGMPSGTDYSLQTGYGDKGFFFTKARTILDPGRPWNLTRGVAIPDLGGDTTLCGTGGNVVLNPGNMGVSSILWSTGASTPTISVSTPGTYWVRVGGASECVRTDTIKVSNSFSINLGLDQNLCNHGSILLDAGHQGTNVTYVWKKNNIILPLDEGRYLTVSAPGNYKVEVSDPSCLPMKSDEIIISSSALSTNSGICVEFPSTAVLSVSNTGGTYRWYNSSTGGSSLSTGSTYTTPSLSSETTYYIADEAFYNKTIIAKTAANGFTNYPGSGMSESTDWLYFDVLNDIQLVSLTTELIVYFSNGSRNATLTITNPSTGFNYNQVISITPPFTNSATPVVIPVVVTLPSILTIPKGAGYRIKIEAAVTVFAYYKGSLSTIVHPKTHGDLIKTTGYSCATGCAIAGMPGMYDWNIRAASTCARTPVTIRDCDGSLPVDFIYLKAHREDGKNIITWLIEETKEPGLFEVEKSKDGIHFEKLFSEIINMHNLFMSFDEYPDGGINYYRIKQIDLEGSFMYSTVVMVPNDTFTFQVNVFPNPSSQAFQISMNSMVEDFNWMLSIYNSSGQLIQEKELSSDARYYFGENLLPGIYILKIKNGFSEQNIKLVKQ